MYKKTVLSICVSAFLTTNGVEAGLFKNVGRVFEDVVKAPVKVIEKTTEVVADVAESTVKEVDRGIESTTKEIERGIESTGEEIGRGVDKVLYEVNSGIENGIEAIEEAGKYADRQFRFYEQLTLDTFERIEDGKFDEAFFHVVVDPYKAQEEHAFRAFKESSALRMGAQAFASAAPGGTAAFSGWYTYRATDGDIEQAVKSSVITYASSEAAKGINSGPANKNIFARSVSTGVVSGSAVALSGGSSEEIRDGFYTGAAMVAAQSLYNEFTEGKTINKEIPDGSFYCKNSTEILSCTPVDNDGNRIMRTIDMETNRNHVGISPSSTKPEWFSENSRFMRSVSQTPYMNSMAIGHDHLVESYFPNDTFIHNTLNRLTIPPAIVFTYAGTDIPMTDKIIQQNINELRNK